MTDSIAVTDPDTLDGSRSLSFQAHGENFDLKLRPNHNLLAPQVRKAKKHTASTAAVQKINKQTVFAKAVHKINKQTVSKQFDCRPWW